MTLPSPARLLCAALLSFGLIGSAVPAVATTTATAPPSPAATTLTTPAPDVAPLDGDNAAAEMTAIPRVPGAPVEPIESNTTVPTESAGALPADQGSTTAPQDEITSFVPDLDWNPLDDPNSDARYGEHFSEPVTPMKATSPLGLDDGGGSAAIAPRRGEYKVTLVTVQLTGKTVADTDAINMTAARNSIDSANNYWRSVSDNKISLRKVNEFRHKSSARITDSYGTIMATVTRELNWQARPYESLVIFVPHADLSYNGSWGILGGGFTDGPTSGRVIMPYPSALTNNVVTHEFGHVLGLHHANTLACNNGRADVPRKGAAWGDSSCWSAEYGDVTDLMGYAQVSQPTINAFMWEYGGFGRGDEIQNLGRITSDRQITLRPWAGRTANRAAKFTDPVSNEVYYLELRAPEGYDAATAVGGNRGVKITKQDAPYGWDGNASVALTPNSRISGWGNKSLTWQAGQTFTTHAGTRVRIDSVSNSSATVSVLSNNKPASGSFDSLTSARNDTTAFLRIRGWAGDPNRPSVSTEAHAYITGPDGVRRGHVIPATGNRPDVTAATVFRGNHGFNGDIPVNRSGRYEVCTFAIGGSANTSLGCKTVQVSNAEAPSGSFDELGTSRVNDKMTLTVRGWVVDPSRSSQSAPAHVYVTAPDGVRTGYAYIADKARTDVNTAFKVSGRHGYEETIAVNAPGRYSVCAHAIGQYLNSELGCRTVHVSAAPPVGSFDTVSVEKTSASSALRIRGWAMERENAAVSVPVHVYVTDPSGRRVGTAFTANKARGDVNRAFNVPGDHGYEETIAAPVAGKYTVCAYGIAVSPSSTVNTLLGCRTVNTGIAESPKGYLDAARIDVTSNGAFLEARGWTVDRDASPASTTVHTYITYPDGTRKGFAYPTGQLRSDVNKAMAITGKHGYTNRTPVTQRGAYQVCTYGIGISPYTKGNALLGCSSLRY